ncbi:S8 family serine peptidase [Trichlorobacter lovleyi]|uniref:S8 family serine peptidase n=1 Tax=Trichlorobacter lovleyi TaxID=313985 RepID=UPI00248129BB|nr:S8 family serine peptidase [Trichlorobacter lovleyi]
MKNCIARLLQPLLLAIALLTTGAAFTAGMAAGAPLSPRLHAITQTAAAASSGNKTVQAIPPSLAEVRGYYSRQGTVSGPVGVVVELEDAPAALVYAQTAKTLGPAQGRKHLDGILQKQNTVMSTLKSRGVNAAEMFRAQKAYNGIWMKVEMKDLHTLAGLPGVKAIHPIIPKVLHHTTSVPLISALQVWGGLGSYQGTGIRIGIIDTGIDYTHAHFGGGTFPNSKVKGGWDFVGDAYNGSNTPVPDNNPMDCYGHGSHVAGSAAGFGVKTDGTTYVESGADTYAGLKDLSAADYTSKFRIAPGVAPKADLYALRVFGCTGSTNVTEQAIEWAMDPNGDGDTSDHLDVINMSLGSAFGSEYDTSAVAANNAALAGVIVVASAGNDGDINYITGSPAVASYAVSVANSVDSGAIGSAFEVTATTAPSATMPVGLYSGVEAAFGPQTFSQTGDLVYASPAIGCSTITNNVSGKIALIDRGTCSFATKVKFAQDAGALGVLIVNNVSSFPFAMSDDGTGASITIPSMMTYQAIGTNLKADLGTGTVTVLLTSAHRNSLVMQDSSIEDTVSSSSSRGLARLGSRLKPDIAAPGDTIFSVKTGSGNQGTSMSGTSMASPHVAGMMALLKQIHPTWSVTELKALAMNTAANDLFTGTNKTGNKYTPSRIGAGRVSTVNAAASQVIAYNTTNPEQVSVAFGVVEVLAGSQSSFTKNITINNKGTEAASYNISFDSRYQTNSGLTFTVLNANGSPLSNPVTVPAGSALAIKVQATVNASLLTKALDPTLVTGERQRFSEGGGYVTLTSTGSAPALRVPVHIAARPASAMSVLQPGIYLPSATTGTSQLTPTGTEVYTSDDRSIITLLELKESMPNTVSSTSPASAAALQYIGAASNYPATAFGSAAMYFGISTYGIWDTPSSVEFDIYIDTNEDGIDDYVVYNSYFTGTDTMISVVANLSTASATAYYYLNGLSGSINTNLFNNNVMTLMAPLSSIGLVEGSNTKFNFRVVSFSHDAVDAVSTSPVMSYDVASQSFTPQGGAIWYDTADSPFSFNYDKSAIAANGSKGLLLLHHHNAVNTAQIVLMPTYAVTYSANGATSGTVPAPQIKYHGIDLTLATNSGSLTKNGYTFTGWNTAADASGTAYPAAGTYSTDATVTLYAVWTPTLSVTVSGTGYGTVTSSPSGISCIKSGNDPVTCDGLFSGTVNLSASPSSISTFGTWGNACSGTGGCSLSMTESKTVTAAFNLAPKAMIASTGYSSFAEAYAAAATDSTTTIMLLEDILPVSTVINKPLKLTGGYLATFVRSVSGSTTLQGTLSIGSGSLVVDRIVVK